NQRGPYLWLFGLMFSCLSASGASPPGITNITLDPICGTMQWTGGTGMMMLQKKITISDPNWANVLTTSNSNARVPRTTENGFFRLQSQVTNTVLAFAVYLDGADEVPAIATAGKGIGALALEGSNLTYYVSFSGL